MMADWIREAFHCRNPVIRVEDFYKVCSHSTPCPPCDEPGGWLQPDSELRRLARHSKGSRVSVGQAPVFGCG